MWKDVVSNLLQAALDIVPYHPSVTLEVVGEDKNAQSLSLNSNSFQGDSLALPEVQQYKAIDYNLIYVTKTILVDSTETQYL